MPIRDNPYLRFRDHELSLNDLLAIDRTVLANERTLLAYGRTALAMVVIGASAIEFFDVLWLEVVGICFGIIGIGIMHLGSRRYTRKKRTLDAAFRPRRGRDRGQP